MQPQALIILSAHADASYPKAYLQEMKFGTIRVKVLAHNYADHICKAMLKFSVKNVKYCAFKILYLLQDTMHHVMSTLELKRHLLGLSAGPRLAVPAFGLQQQLLYQACQVIL